MAVGIRGYSPMYSGGTYRVRMGAVPAWETAYNENAEFRKFADNIRRNRNWGPAEYAEAWDEFKFQKQLGSDRRAKEKTERRRRQYAAAGLEYKPVSGVIRSVKSSGPSASSLKRKQEREQRKAEIKSKQAEKADLRWLSGYDAKREKLMKELDHQDAQVRADAQRKLSDLELERQMKENKLATTIPVGVQQLRASEAKRTEIRGVIEQLNKWIADNPDKPEAIAEINRLIKQAERPGASAESIARQAESTVFAAEKKAQREFGRKQKLQEERAEQTRSLAELKSKLSEESKQQDREFRAELEKAKQTNASNTTIRKAKEKIESIIRKKQGDVANLTARIRSVGAEVGSDGVLTKMPMLPEGSKLISDIEGAARTLQGHIAEIEFYSEEYSKLPEVSEDLSGFDEGPQPGDVIDGYEFLGGDPSQQSSWRQAR